MAADESEAVVDGTDGVVSFELVVVFAGDKEGFVGLLLVADAVAGTAGLLGVH